MSIKISKLVWIADLCPRDKLVMLRLADHADDQGGRIFPSVASISSHTGFSTRTVQRVLKRYVDSGLLVVEANFRGGRRPRYYRFNLLMLRAMGSNRSEVERRRTVGGDNMSHPTGDVVDAKGCHSLASEPSLTVNETVAGNHDDKNDCVVAAKSLWQRNQSAVAQIRSGTAEGAWLELLRPIQIRDGCLELAAPSRLTRDQVEMVCRAELEKVFECPVKIVVNALFART